MTGTYFTHQELAGGGELELVMSDKPSSTFGTGKEDRPVSSINDHLIVPLPYVTNNRRTFYDSLTVEIGDAVTGTIHYTADGRDPDRNSTEYEKPLIFHQTTTLKAMMLDNGGEKSGIVTARYIKIPKGRSIRLLSTYSPQYSAGGEQALMDYIRGPENFRTGRWQGFQGRDFEAVVDLGKTEHFSYIAIGFLQDERSWIFMPEYVVFFVSEDGKTFVPVGKVINTVPPDEERVIIKDFSVNVYPKEMRYVKVFAKSRLVCPPWHPGAGEKAWLFADEIVIK